MVEGLSSEEKKSLDYILSKGYTPKQVKEFIDGLQRQESQNIKPYSIGGNHVKFLLFGDTHIGNIAYDKPLMKHAAKVARDEKVDFAAHTGDIFDGWYQNRPSSIFEQNAVGFDNQMKMAVEELSQLDVPLVYITGNHSYNTFVRGAGVEAGPYLEMKLKAKGLDANFLGNAEGDIHVGKTLIRLLHPDGGTAYALCFDDKTEIYTDEGWKYFKNLKKENKVATLNPKTMTLEFQKPHAYTDEYYLGDMISIGGKRFNMMVTPNHRLFVKRPWKNRLLKNNGWKFITADSLKGRQFSMLRTIPNWDGIEFDRLELKIPSVKPHGKLQNFVSSVDAGDWFELCGWILSEGNISHANKAVEISQSSIINPKKYQRIVDLIERLGFTCYKMENKIKITSKQMYEIFKNMGKSHEKKIPNYIHSASKYLIQRFLTGLYLGDGTFLNGVYQNYTTNSPKLADAVQILLMKLGYSGVIKRYDNRKSNFNQTRPVYQISCSTKSVSPCVEVDPVRINYSGRIYCVSVPNQIILTRREGKAIWSGNSYKPQKIVESLESGHKPHFLGIGHFHKADYMFYRNVHVIQSATLCGQTKFMKGKGIAAHKGFWVVDMYVKDDGQIDAIRPMLYPAYR